MDIYVSILFVFISAEVTGHIMEEQKGERWKIIFHIFNEPATACCTTEQHVANAGE